MVGKTNLIQVAMGKEFQEKSVITLVTSNYEKEINVNGNNYILKLWDTIGQEKYRSLTRIFYQNSKIIILVYDKSRKTTFENLDFWINEIKYLKRSDYILALVGNKADLDDAEDDVNEEEARKIANDLDAKFRMVSAKMDPNGFVNFLKELLKDYLAKNNISVKVKKGVSLSSKKAQDKNKCKC